MLKSSEAQPSLFAQDKPHNVTLIKNIDGYEVPVTYGKEGSYVDTRERAEHLIIALSAISERNRRDGFSVAPYTEPYSAPIWERYQENTQDVIDGASRNRNMYQNILRQNFWHATGFAALRGSGLIRERQINPRAQKMWRDFNDRYSHPAKVSDRNKYKKQLQNQVRSHQESELAA
jgi:hypothetical protein